jgi:hypothetical protein
VPRMKRWIGPLGQKPSRTGWTGGSGDGAVGQQQSRACSLALRFFRARRGSGEKAPGGRRVVPSGRCRFRRYDVCIAPYAEQSDCLLGSCQSDVIADSGKWKRGSRYLTECIGGQELGEAQKKKALERESLSIFSSCQSTGHCDRRWNWFCFHPFVVCVRVALQQHCRRPHN